MIIRQQGFSQIILALIIVVVIGLGIFFIKQKPSTTPQPSPAQTPYYTPEPTVTPSSSLEDMGNGYKKYRNTVDKYEITLPDSWIALPTFSSVAIFTSHKQQSQGYGFPYNPPETISFNISKDEYPRNSVYLKQVFGLKIDQKLVGDKLDTTKLAELSINGLPAVKVSTSSDNKPTESIPNITYYIKSGDDYYELSFNANSLGVLDSKENGLTIYQIVDSFKIIN